MINFVLYFFLLINLDWLTVSVFVVRLMLFYLVRVMRVVNFLCCAGYLYFSYKTCFNRNRFYFLGTFLQLLFPDFDRVCLL